MVGIDRRSRARAAIRLVAGKFNLPTQLTILSERWNTVVSLGDSGVVAKCATLADLARSDPRHWFQLELDVCGELLARGVAVQKPFQSRALLEDGFAITLWHEVPGELGECSEEQLVQSLVTMHRAGGDLLSDQGWFATITSHFDDIFPLLADRNVIPASTLSELASLYGRLMDSIMSMDLRNSFIHGDAQRKNAMRTSQGAVWIDFEECSYGPVAWDLACLTMNRSFDTDRVLDRYAELIGHPRIPTECIETMKQLRDLEAVTWMLAIQEEREPTFRDAAANMLQEVLTAANAD